jgi:hypothetical protein
VADFVIGEQSRFGSRFDQRFFVGKALPVYWQWKRGETESHWRDLVSASAEGHMVEARGPGPVSRAEGVAGDRALALAIRSQYLTREARRRAWAEQTRRSERAYYRCLGGRPA